MTSLVTHKFVKIRVCKALKVTPPGDHYATSGLIQNIIYFHFLKRKFLPLQSDGRPVMKFIGLRLKWSSRILHRSLGVAAFTFNYEHIEYLIDEASILEGTPSHDAFSPITCLFKDAYRA